MKYLILNKQLIIIIAIPKNILTMKDNIKRLVQQKILQ